MSVGVLTLIYGNVYILYSDLSYFSNFTATCWSGRGDLTLTSCESSRKLIGVDAQKQLVGFKPNKAFFHTCGEHNPHLVFPDA
jgi:hypothetical protein